LHLLPHWNWPGKEGQEIRVDALSNCKQVELFLNGESLGKKTLAANAKLSWQVKYAPGILSAKGYDDAGNLITESKEETTGAPAAIRLTPDRSTLNANGEDVSVLTVSAVDDQGRPVPVAQNQINFQLEGAGSLIGVGNGDPSCHEPDVFAADVPIRTIAVSNWRWHLTEVPKRGALAPGYAPDFDDSTWNTIRPKTDGDTGDMVLREGESAIYRAHVTVTAEDLASNGVQVRFTCIDDRGWIFVNNQRVGESTDWQSQPAFDIKSQLHVGDNVIAVGVVNESGDGGLNPDVNLELAGKPIASAWSRSLFNGLAQVMVQATRDAGTIKVTALANGLQPATATLQTVPGGLRPSVP
jgi:beta-galactosidase